MTSYISDDGFEDFRNWVILNGKDSQIKTIENPEYISSHIEVNDAVEEVIDEPLLFICEEAWGGDIEDLEENYVYPQEPIIDSSWPKKEKLEEEFPILFSKFWDEENIKTLNKC